MNSANALIAIGYPCNGIFLTVPMWGTTSETILLPRYRTILPTPTRVQTLSAALQRQSGDPGSS